MRIVFTTTHPAPYFDRLFCEIEKHGIRVDEWYNRTSSRTKLWNNYHKNNIQLYSAKNIFKFMQACMQADAIVLHWGNVLNVIVAFLLRITGRPCAFFLDYPANIHPKLYEKIIKHILFSIPNCVFPASYNCAQFLIDNYKLRDTKIKVFPYLHSNCKSLDNQERINDLLHGDRIRILITNRFIDRKGYNYVVDALKVLANKNLIDFFNLTIVGSGIQKDYYTNIISKLCPNAQFLDWVENDEYESIVSKTDVLIHASKLEPFGIPPLDAMNRNKFVIVSDGIKSTATFTNCRGIIIYPHDNSLLLAKAIEYVLLNKDSIYKLAEDNRNLCTKSYSVNVNIESLNALLQLKHEK